jgi:hypothetical protein
VNAAPPSVTDRFARIIDLLCRTVAAQGRAPNSLANWGPSAGGLVAGPLIILIWTKLRRAAARFAALAARVHAGTLASATRRACAKQTLPLPLAGEGRGEGLLKDVRAPSPRAPRLPNTFGWLIRLVPAAACSRSQLQHLLSDPEIAALLTAAPQIGRVLRPLCRALAIGPSPDLPPSLLSPSPRPPTRERQPTNIQTPAPPANPQITPHPPPDPLQIPLPPPAPA